jgi:hypothetical protein
MKQAGLKRAAMTTEGVQRGDKRTCYSRIDQKAGKVRSGVDGRGAQGVGSLVGETWMAGSDVVDSGMLVLLGSQNQGRESMLILVGAECGRSKFEVKLQ